MRRRFHLSSALTLMLGALPAIAFGQTTVPFGGGTTATAGGQTTTVIVGPTSVAEALTASSLPKTITLADMGVGAGAPGQQQWVRFRIAGGANDSAGAYGELLNAFSGGGGTAEYYYTAGQQIHAAGAPYLIAYKQIVAPLDYATLMRSGNFTPPQPPALTAATKLSLCLLNLTMIKGLSDVQPVDASGIVAESRQQHNQTADVIKLVYSGSATSSSGMSSMASGESNAKKLIAAINKYRQTHGDAYPALTSIPTVMEALTPYVQSNKVFVNPDTDSLFSYNARYSGMESAEIAQPKTAVLVYSDECDVCGKRIIGYADGHVETVDAQQWAKLKESAKLP